MMFSDFEKCKALLWALDVLDAAGQFESPAADSLREASVAPWYRLTQEQRAELNQLATVERRSDSGQRADNNKDQTMFPPL